MSSLALKGVYQESIVDRFGPKCVLSAITLLLAAIAYAGNMLFFKYKMIYFIDWSCFKYLIPLFMLNVTAHSVKDEYPRLTLLLRTLTENFLILYITAYFAQVCLTTPFPLRDNFIYHLDLMMHFNIGRVYLWSVAHPVILTLAHHIWFSLLVELPLVPIVLSMFHQVRRLQVFFVGLLLANLIGFTFYYFFPTTDPAHVMPKIHFPDVQYLIINRFINIHNVKNFTNAISGGIISCPSFHVIWAVLLTYSMKNKKFLFYPLAIYNFLVICSTLFTGWHFLTDVLGGFIVAAITIVFAEKWVKEEDPVSLPPLQGFKHWIGRSPSKLALAKLST